MIILTVKEKVSEEAVTLEEVIDLIEAALEEEAVDSEEIEAEEIEVEEAQEVVAEEVSTQEAVGQAKTNQIILGVINLQIKDGEHHLIIKHLVTQHKMIHGAKIVLLMMDGVPIITNQLNKLLIHGDNEF
jgi:hypothetical protein